MPTIELSFITICLFCFVTFSLALHQVPAHDCQRECDDGPARRCDYHFHIEYYYTMSKACYDCPYKLEGCDRHHCIAADGVERGVVSINRQIPGPSIQVCQGDEIVVDVTNHLRGEGSALHWHGMHMKGSPYMDGVPLVTQCPISPASTFQYSFVAENSGTHYYHSHSGFQRADGAFGSLIVRQSRLKDPLSSLYDHDLPEHVILVSDWLSELGLAKFVAHAHGGKDDIPSSIIINGKGRVSKPKDQLELQEMMPLAVFNVEKGMRYRFRMISNGILDCPVTMSIDNHTLLIIASDGNPIQPVEVDSLVMTSGERFDFVLKADQVASSFWIRFRGNMDWNSKHIFQTAILRYENSPEVEPDGIVTYETTSRNGTVLNPINYAPGDERHLTVAELTALTAENETEWTREPDRKFFLAYDFNAVDNWLYHDPEHYPIFGVENRHRFFTPQINHISLRMPSSPPLSQLYSLPPDSFCNESTVTNCKEKHCACSYTLHVPLGSLVEVILIDEGATFDATHPFHLHGSSFRVVAMKRVGSQVSVNEIRALDENGLIKRNLIDAPIKDTVAVPDGGYTVIRFMATNPGYWLLHCHLEFHSEVGMGVIFKIGNDNHLPPVPDDFPTCGNWFPSKSSIVNENFDSTISKHTDVSSAFDINGPLIGENELLALALDASPFVHLNEDQDRKDKVPKVSSLALKASSCHFSLALYTIITYCLSNLCFRL
uniref:Multicopper oxidase n=1 Tax=Daphnia magna TaxID=35525 RepID=A0A0P5ZF44_9CRUS